MPRPIHFEIHASDPERVQAFYRTPFGCQFQSWGGPVRYWVITTGDAAQPGINGGWLAYIKDPDGNILGVTQQDASAR